MQVNEVQFQTFSPCTLIFGAGQTDHCCMNPNNKDIIMIGDENDSIDVHRISFTFHLNHYCLLPIIHILSIRSLGKGFKVILL